MSQPIFLNITEVMQILLGELPQGVYASDFADLPNVNMRSYSSSEIRAHAQVYANIYSNLQDIYQNKFLSTVQPSAIGSWEKDLFVQVIDSSTPFETRKQNALTKYRATGGISYIYIYNLIFSILQPLGLDFTLATFCGMPMGAWHLDVSPLDRDTFLAEQDPILGAVQTFTPLDCSLDYAAAGLTLAQFRSIQATAYTYAVYIYGNADAMTLSTLDQVLTQAEPGGSTHIIINNSPLPIDPNILDLGGGSGCTLIDAIDCGTGEIGATFNVWDLLL